MKKFFYEQYQEGNTFVTKVFADIPHEAYEILAVAEQWDGCHWDAPNLVFCEQVEGDEPSPDAAAVIKALKAVPWSEWGEIYV